MRYLRNKFYYYKYSISEMCNLGEVYINGLKYAINIDAKKIGEKGLSKTIITSKNGGQIKINKNSIIREGCKIENNGKGVIEIGFDTNINENTMIKTNGNANIIIKNNCEISWNCQILGSDFHQILYNSKIKKSFCADVFIGEHVWIGTNSIILKNTKIGNNCVIQANSLVIGQFPDNCLIGGNPAKILKYNINFRNLSSEEKKGFL
ncbi:acyltransferase [Halarcobacter ebronensis]|nr:acyltransferase [Halarcobacter ebronensis]QKF81087.1 acyltransferase [Halarcobacter ebronensis]